MTVDELLAEARRAARGGDWTAAADAYVRAAVEGSREGADGAVAVAPRLRDLADGGRADAAALLAGILLEYCEDAALPTAAEYARRAADAGDPAGLRTYGYLLLEGRGVAPDRARAAGLLRAAADAGDAYAAFNLAQLILGDGAGDTAPDRDRAAARAEALRLLEGAALHGVVPAGAVLGDRLSDEDRDDEALHWYLRAAEQGHTGAMYAAACRYRDGLGTAPDAVQAIRWYFAMCAHGDGDGIHDAIAMARHGLVSADGIREAGALAGDPSSAEALIDVVFGPDAAA
ncbi:hypothetical protein [Streptomyces sp. CC228A]|uniref:hypothetical protein n=1 Tax=Streptomyces sp. CC228A TaxID=2898186 RepID=UPI001F2C98E7|nr:hypothetical protein [Streptomyces sp. CC228A]